MVVVVDNKPHPSVVKEKYVKDYGGGTDLNRWIDCPNCNHPVQVK